AGSLYTFLATDVGKNASFDQRIHMMESFGAKINDQTYARMEQTADQAKYFGAAGQAVTLPVIRLIIAAIAFAIFNDPVRGDASFTQVCAVVAHSGVVLTLSQLFGLPLAYARETLSGATNLAVFAPFLPENSFGANLLGGIDLFVLWWTINVAIGLGVLYKK